MKNSQPPPPPKQGRNSSQPTIRKTNPSTTRPLAHCPVIPRNSPQPTPTPTPQKEPKQTPATSQQTKLALTIWHAVEFSSYTRTPSTNFRPPPGQPDQHYQTQTPHTTSIRTQPHQPSTTPAPPRHPQTGTETEPPGRKEVTPGPATTPQEAPNRASVSVAPSRATT